MSAQRLAATPEVAFTAQGPDGIELWRTAVLDAYDGATWRSSGVYEPVGSRLPEAAAPGEARRRGGGDGGRAWRRPFVPLPGRAVRVDGVEGRFDAATGVLLADEPLADGTAYSVEAAVGQPSDAALDAAERDRHGPDAAAARRPVPDAAALSEIAGTQVATRTAGLTGTADVRQLRALQEFFADQGRFRLATTPVGGLSLRHLTSFVGTAAAGRGERGVDRAVRGRLRGHGPHAGLPDPGRRRLPHARRHRRRLRGREPRRLRLGRGEAHRGGVGAVRGRPGHHGGGPAAPAADGAGPHHDDPAAALVPARCRPIRRPPPPGCAGRRRRRLAALARPGPGGRGGGVGGGRGRGARRARAPPEASPSGGGRGPRRRGLARDPRRAGRLPLSGHPRDDGARGAGRRRRPRRRAGAARGRRAGPAGQRRPLRAAAAPPEAAGDAWRRSAEVLAWARRPLSTRARARAFVDVGAAVRGRDEADAPGRRAVVAVPPRGSRPGAGCSGRAPS